MAILAVMAMAWVTLVKPHCSPCCSGTKAIAKISSCISPRYSFACLECPHFQRSEKTMPIRKLVVFAMLLLCSALLVSAATIPAGTRVTVRSGSELSSGTAHSGQTWEGSLAKDVVVNGQTVAHA